MFKTAEEAEAFFDAFLPVLIDGDDGEGAGAVEVMVCPPYLALRRAVECCAGARVLIGSPLAVAFGACLGAAATMLLRRVRLERTPA